MAREKRVVIFNKGGRNWPLKDEGKDVSVAPNKSIELPKSVAARMVRNYPDDFIHGDSMAVSGSGAKALNAKIKRLTAENETLKAENEKIVSQFNEMTAQIEELEAAADAIPVNEPETETAENQDNTEDNGGE